MSVDPELLADLIPAPVVHGDEMGSTNDHARQLAREGRPHGTFVIADEQSAGRGRTGNVWASPRGGLWTTILLQPTLPASHVGRLTFAGGLAAVEAVRSTGVEPALKWPNDVLVEGRKLGGVLTEAVIEGIPVAGKPVDEVLPGTSPATAELDCVLLGIGINANLDATALGLDRPVTTLRELVGDVDMTSLATALHERVLSWTERVETEAGFEEALSTWRELDVTRGARVRVQRRGRPAALTGTAVGVTDTGALEVEVDGSIVEIAEGDVEQLRPLESEHDTT